MASTRMRITTSFLVAALMFGAASCGNEKQGRGPQDRRHSLAAAIEQVKPHIRGLSDGQSEDLDNFLEFSGVTAAPLEIRKACELAGIGLKEADADAIAGFVLQAADSLYDDFFRILPPERLPEIAQAIQLREELPEVERVRLGMVIGDGGGAYHSTLARTLKAISLHTALAPASNSRESYLPGEGVTAASYSGAAEALRIEPLVRGGAQPEAAIDVLERGVELFPEDPALRAGLISCYSADEEVCRLRLRALLRDAAKREPDNAGWLYLIAMRAFREGRDEEGLAALRAATKRKKVTFHTFARAENLVKLLRERGYGKLRARICSLRILSDPLYFDLKLLANFAIKRSHEYLDTRTTEDMKTVLEFPQDLDRLLEGGPHPQLGQRIRWTILANGIKRQVAYYDRHEPDRTKSVALLQKVSGIEKKLKSIERGQAVCGGREIWTDLYGVLGEEKFLKYVDGVLFGNEAEFLSLCAARTGLEDCLELTQQSYPFN